MTTVKTRTMTKREKALWLSDKIIALGDYAKEAAELLRQWPECESCDAEWLAGYNQGMAEFKND